MKGCLYGRESYTTTTLSDYYKKYPKFETWMKENCIEPVEYWIWRSDATKNINTLLGYRRVELDSIPDKVLFEEIIEAL